MTEAPNTIMFLYLPKKKRWLPHLRQLFLLLLLLISIQGFALGFTIDDITYERKPHYSLGGSIEGYYAVVVSYKGTGGDVVIPASVYDYDRRLSVEGIEKEAFSGCTGLTSVAIPERVKWIREKAFADCTGLTSVTIPASVKWIDQKAFLDCTGLTSVTIPGSVNRIEQETFSGCTGLTSVLIPSSIAEIGARAFSGCTGLTSLTIPGSVMSIESGAFAGCTSLLNIEVDSANTKYRSINGVLYSKDGNLTALIAWPGGKTEITIPDSVTEIGSGAFSGCTGLTSVSIPDSVTEIGSGAFSGCTGLTSVTIPDSVTEIGSGAFSGCSGLATVTIPSSVMKIKEGTFSGCTGLTSVTIPESVTEIYENAFNGCTGLTSVTIPGEIWIDREAFSGCNLRPLKILSKDKVSIHKDAFKGMKDTSEIVCYSCNYNEISRIAEAIEIPVFMVDVPQITLSDINSYYCGISFTCVIDNPYIEVDLDKIAYFADVVYGYEWNFHYVIDNIPVSISTSNLLKGLSPNGNYTLIIYYYNEESEKVICGKYEVVTKKANFRVEYEITQTTLTVKSMEADSDETCPPLKFHVQGKEYTGGTFKLTGLNPNSNYLLDAVYDDYYLPYEVITKDIDVNVSGSGVYPNAIECDGVYDLGDAKLGGVEWILNGETVSNSERLVLTGLTPEKQYPVYFKVNVACDDGTVYSKTWSQTFTTKALKMEMQPPKSVGNGKTIVSAKTNISENEANVGFEWKKVDAPETLPYSRGYAAVYDGSLEGLIQNLQANYYNVRAFYQDASGHYYYTDIVSFDPTDFSFFEPTVHTYPAETGENHATLRGYALGGTDDVEEQGFQYWIVSSENRIPQYGSSRAPERDVMTVTAEGQRMSVVISDLKPGTTYAFRAFVKTKSSVKYGEEMTFETLGTGDVEDIVSEDEGITIVGYYDLSGRRYTVPQRGFNIVLYSNGESRKMVCK